MIQLRPHQERGVAAMQKHSKGQLIVPTGGGKTLKMIYDARNEYLKAKKSVEFWQREISFLKECEDDLKKGRTEGWLYREMFGDTPLAEEVYGG